MIWVVGQDVDPAARSIATDLDLGRRQPAVALDPSDDISRTASVCRIALELAVGTERGRHSHGKAAAHGLEQSRRVSKTQVWQQGVLNP